MNQRTASQAARLLTHPSRSSREDAATAPAQYRQHGQDPAEAVTCRLGDASCAGAHASTLRRSTGGAPAQARDSLLQLQRGYGNRFVQRVLEVARQSESESLDEGGEVPASVERGIERARGGGQALDSAVRARMEPVLGTGLDGVRVHTGAEADHLSRQISARAFTTGGDIFFRQGEYDPASRGGRELLAHELTHVAQGGGAVQGKLALGAARSPAEDEADQVARQVMRQEDAPVQEEDREDEIVRRQPADAGVIRRLVGETQDIERLRTLLDDDQEKEAITLMGTLSKDDVAKVLENREFRELAVSAFNNDEMARAAIAMAPKGRLYRLLEWMFDEGTDLSSVHTVIREAAGDRKEVLSDGWMRDQFVSLCNNEEMATVTRLLGGTLLERLDWMLAEGTDSGLVHQAIREASDAELAAVKNDDRKVLTRLQDELSKEGFRRARQMLDGLLNWEEVEHKSKEQHYEQEDPTKPWELEEFKWTTAYEIRYSRTELRLIVRIQLTGEETTPAQRQVWSAGIANRWNGKFHLENDRRLPLVVEPVFTSDDSHVKVKVHQAGKHCVRENRTNWCLSTTGDTAAHELGHMLGLEDEYNLTKADYERLVGPAPAGAEPAGGYTHPGLMTGGFSDVEGRHLQPYLRWLNAHRLKGEKPYRLVPGA